MSNEELDPRPEQSPEKLDARGRNRRRLSKAALGTAPVLMTLHAAPLKAAGANCTPSGWISGNTSKHHELEDCGGRTPGAWQGGSPPEPRESWEAILFRDKFTAQFFTEDDDEATLLDAVKGPGQLPLLYESGGMLLSSLDRQLARFGAAAWLNAEYVPGYVVDQDTIVYMVNAALADVDYVTPSGDTLTPKQVKAFLENTMDTPTWGP